MSAFFSRSLVVLVGATLFAPALAEAGELTPTTVLRQSTLNGGGGVSTSSVGAGHRLEASIGQESVIGTSASFDRVLQSGFWSFAGSGLVPVLLFGNRETTTKELRVNLDWTGNNPPYALFRSLDCANVTQSWLLSQPGLAWTDVAPPAGDLVCYSVFATPPGPIAPGEWAAAPTPAGTLERSGH